MMGSFTPLTPVGMYLPDLLSTEPGQDMKCNKVALNDLSYLGPADL
jgi:hypothetical protein